MSQNNSFTIGQKVVYPAHGVGEITKIEDQIVAGQTIRVYAIYFLSAKMTLRVPIIRSDDIGLRDLIDQGSIEEIYEALKGTPRSGNKMWSRRALDYETKINSGDVISIAEVVRDLYKNVDNERSYSERTIYESALSRLSEEIACLKNISHEDAQERLVDLLKEKALAAS